MGTHDEAVRLVRDKPYDKEKFDRLAKESKERGESWGGQPWQNAIDACKLPYWDVVLSDLLMPAGQNTQGGKGLQYVGVEMPIGWALAIDAALGGAKFVAVVTDMNHHSHPASAMLDRMDNGTFELSGAKALFTNHVEMVGIAGTEHTCTECNGTGKTDGGKYRCYKCTDGVAYSEKGKDWKKILDRLTGTPSEAYQQFCSQRPFARMGAFLLRKTVTISPKRIRTCFRACGVCGRFR